ncbi:hypothetical protein SteCoe_35012 [Stentor coeruleus]|uniref:G-protein coupled receptors family 1 profile domain-containing protein n=1 Tax=Stentor coeruleus TaxID=5963 RepID=A0A1R2ATB1_9CILI|nr:hypothetical protein SteCoe_35012 [Stentor coeruleus]
MKNSFFIVVTVGLSAGIFCSTLVLIQLLIIKYKDLANKVIFLLILTDLLMGLISICLALNFQDLYCKVTIFFASLIRNIHKFIVLFISYTLYRIIVQNKSITSKVVKFYTFFVLFYSIAQSVFVVLLLNNVGGQTFCILDNNSILSTWYVICSEYFFTFAILVLITYFYLCIRKHLIYEIKNTNCSIIGKRIFAKRLIGFCFVFSFAIVPSAIVVLLMIFGILKDQEISYDLATIFYAWYPFFDSLMYGFTKSFKKNIFNLCMKDPDFESQEEIFYLMRQENMLKPRFYLDLIEKTELGEFAID